MPREAVERDYAAGYLLASLSGHPRLKDALALKGGAALKKLYFDDDYRFSEEVVIAGGWFSLGVSAVLRGRRTATGCVGATRGMRKLTPLAFGEGRGLHPAAVPPMSVGGGERGWQDVGRRFFEDLSDDELKRQIDRDTVALARFENAVRDLPVDTGEVFTAQDLRAKIARFERECTDRAAEKNRDPWSKE